MRKQVAPEAMFNSRTGVRVKSMDLEKRKGEVGSSKSQGACDGVACDASDVQEVAEMCREAQDIEMHAMSGKRPEGWSIASVALANISPQNPMG